MAATVFNSSATPGVTIDNTTYNNIVWLTCKRSFSVLDTENTGRTMADGAMHRDILGTYYTYTLSFRPLHTAAGEAEYDSLYEVLSSPTASHRIVLPYGQGTIAYDAYVTSGEDELVRTDAYGSIWSKLEVNFIAMQAARVPT